MNVEQKKVLENLEKTRNIFWNIPKNTAEFLQMLIHGLQAKKVLEIGTSNGYSGIFLASALAQHDGLLYTVESHHERFFSAQENFKQAGLEKFIKQIYGHAPEILSEITEIFDLVFIDATKMEYKSYFQAFASKIKKYGIIVADNCITHAKDLHNFMEFIKTNADFQSCILPFDNGLLMSIKIG